MPSEREFYAMKRRMIKKIEATQREIGVLSTPPPLTGGARHIGLTMHCKHGLDETCNECLEVEV